MVTLNRLESLLEEPRDSMTQCRQNMNMYESWWLTTQEMTWTYLATQIRWSFQYLSIKSEIAISWITKEERSRKLSKGRAWKGRKIVSEIFCTRLDESFWCFYAFGSLICSRNCVAIQSLIDPSWYTFLTYFSWILWPKRSKYSCERALQT